jgi:hypothetical protein
MDGLDWKFDKSGVIFNLLIQAVLATVATIAVGYFLHVGWALYEP